MIGTTALVDSIAHTTEMPRARVQRVLDELATVAQQELASGNDVRLPGIGILRSVQRRERSGTGPDGRPWTKPAHMSARLSVGTELRRALAAED